MLFRSDLIVRLPDGSHAAVAMSWTDSGGGAAEVPADSPLALLDLAGLRQVVRLLEQLRQEGRWPLADKERTGKLCTGCVGDLLYCLKVFGVRAAG